ncbi:MAG: pyruvate kinase [Ferruginibacter sp.]|nr:pyruvate kinase [Cytophagales bacterium]
MSIAHKRTKIVATVGPACNKKEQLLALVHAGVDVFRLNFSHGTHEEHARVIGFVRELNEEHNLNICLLQDLQGPKIRTREVENNGVMLERGQQIVLTNEKVLGTAARISTTYSSMYQDVKPGDRVLLDDGKLELRVKRIDGTDVVAEVVYGGLLKSKKGMNLPNTLISTPALTEKDREDLMFGLQHNVEWVALSFVRTAAEMLEVKEIIRAQGKDARVIAKIEKPEAITNMDAIIEASDGLMVARGDLGVEIVAEEVPMVQKTLVLKCNRAAKPVIIATQMMESMITSPRPTRAETNDIANSVIDGADAVMLSAETASGAYPVLTVESMARTVRLVEEQADIYYKNHNIEQPTQHLHNDKVVVSACRLARDTNAKAIVGMTRSGYTAFRLSSHRPKSLIYVFTSNARLLNTVGLLWGVQAYPYDKMTSTEETFKDVRDLLIEKGHLTKGDVFISTAGMPFNQEQRTNTVKLDLVE